MTVAAVPLRWPMPVIRITAPPLVTAACLFGDCAWTVAPASLTQVMSDCADHRARYGHTIFARTLEDVVALR